MYFPLSVLYTTLPNALSFAFDNSDTSTTKHHVLCIGNHMILSVIWNKITSSSKIFQRLTKLNKSVGQVQFGVFEKFTSFLRCLFIILCIYSLPKIDG